MKIIRPIEVTTARLLSSDVPETDYAEYNAGTTYALGNTIIVAADHKIYESLQNSNTGHTPSSSPTWWLEISATNRWKMFDEIVGSQTTNPDGIDVTVEVSDERADSVMILNASAETVRVSATDEDDNSIFDETQSGIFDSGITDWYAYFFEPIQRKSEFYFTGILPYTNAKIRIELTDVGDNALCGECIIGLSKEIGGTQYGARVGIQDFSVKEVDAFGGFMITERAFAARASFTVLIANAYVDALIKLLSDIRATPTVFIGTDSFNSSIVYGFYRDFTVEIAYREYSLCTIDTEGLT